MDSTGGAVVAMAFAAAAVMGCAHSVDTQSSDVEGGPGTTSDGAASDAPPSDAPAGRGEASSTPDASACMLVENDAGTCNLVDPNGPTVVATCVSGEPPAPQGGTIENGAYALQAFTYYGSCPAYPDLARTTWTVCGDHWDIAQVTPLNPIDPDAGWNPAVRLNYLSTVQPTTVTFNLVCGGAGMPMSRGYTASPGHLRFIFEYRPGEPVVAEYTRQ